MVSVSTEIVIDKPLDKVSGFSVDPENATQWYENIKSVEYKTEKPLRIGSQIAFIAHFMGRQLYYIYKVTEMTDQRFVMQTEDGPFPMKTVYAWFPVNDSSTRMVLRNEGQPSGFFRLLKPFMSIVMRKANRKDLKKLKAVLERR